MTETEPSPAAEPKQAPKRGRVPRWVVATAVLGVIVGVIGAILYYGYTTRPGWVGVADKKFWDYLELLIVPAALAIGVYLLNRAQSEREGAAEEARNQRELEFASETTQNAALQSYIDQITQLLIYGNAPKLLSETRIRETIHARTLHVLDQLDESSRGHLRKRALLRFLYKTELIPGRQPEGPPYDTSMLFGANLRGVNLEGLRLEGADLCGADLCGANLRGANLSRASLARAKPEENAVLTDVDLSFASLEGAKSTDEQLTNCKSLEGATMPDGQILKSDDNPDRPTFEDWLKSKSRGEEGENTGP